MRRGPRSLSAAVVSSCVLSAVASPCLAEEPRPAPELSQLDVTLGNWESSGTWRQFPDAEPVRWTAVGTTEKVLGGFFIQETTRIGVGAEGAQPLVMRGLIGWDAASKRFRQVGVSNMGFGGLGTLHVAEKGKFVSSSTRTEGGEPVVELGVSEYAGDKGSFRIDRSVGGGKFYVSVEGTMKRGGPGCPADALGAAAVVPPPAELGAIDGQLGTWTYKARISPMSGLPMMEVSGKEAVSSILGGHAHLGVITGDAMPGSPQAYRGESYLVWDSEQGSYLSVDADNFGAFTVSSGHRAGERKMLYLAAGPVYGELCASRTIVAWNEDASVIEVTSQRLAGTAAAETSFEGRFVRVKE